MAGLAFAARFRPRLHAYVPLLPEPTSSCLRAQVLFTYRSAVGSKLDIGCGHRKHAGAIGLDVVGSTQADVVCDLNRPPWPFDDDTFDDVFAYNILEHLPNTVATMAEIHRICRNDARVHIETPHHAALESWEDPTHVHHFSLDSFDYFCGGGRHVGHYTRALFRVIRKELHFGGHPLAWIGRLLYFLSPRGYEKRWSFVFRPSRLEVHLAVVKDRGSGEDNAEESCRPGRDPSS